MDSTNNNAIGADGLEIILGEQKLLREEINVRIREHHQLVWIKLVSLGAVMAFIGNWFIQKQTDLNYDILQYIAPYLIWIIPFMAITFDMLIADNIRTINNIGWYIRMHMENNCFVKFLPQQTDFRFWETVVAQSDMKQYRCYGAKHMIAIWLMTLASSTLTATMQFRILISVKYFVISVCILSLLSIFSLYYMIRALMMKREF